MIPHSRGILTRWTDWWARGTDLRVRGRGLFRSCGSKILRGWAAGDVDSCEAALGFLVAGFARTNLLVVCVSSRLPESPSTICAPLLSLFSADLAIDLGTVNTRVYARDRGIVVHEPSAVALDDRTGEVHAVGKEAKEMLGRTPSHIRVVKPLKDGVIADFKVTEKMLSYFIQKAHQRRTLVHPRIVISIPSEVTQVEKRAVTDAAYRTKAAEVHLVEQAMMAANWRRSARYQTGRQHGGGHRRWSRR